MTAPARGKERERVGRGVYKTERWKALSEAKRKAVKHCQRCGVFSRLVLDHVVELRDGGHPWADSNLQLLCWSCHTTKTNEARAARMPGRPPASPEGGGGVLKNQATTRPTALNLTKERGQSKTGVSAVAIDLNATALQVMASLKRNF